MISQETVNDIAKKLQSVEYLDEQAVSGLRQSYEGVHFTYCNDDDISEVSPVLEQENFNLYLVNGRDHCLTMTKDFNLATGVVVAEVYPE